LTAFSDLFDVDRRAALLEAWGRVLEKDPALEAPDASQRAAELDTLARWVREGAAGSRPLPRRSAVGGPALARSARALGKVLFDLAAAAGVGLSLDDARIVADFLLLVGCPPATTDGDGSAPSNLRDVLMQAPLAMALLEGPAHTFTFANPAYLALASGQDLVGAPLPTVPTNAKGHGFEALLDRVMETGAVYQDNEVQLPGPVPSTDGTRSCNLVYQPVRRDAEPITRVLVCATEVTEQVKARQRVETAAEGVRRNEARLQMIIEATQAGTWELEARTNRVFVDARMRAMLGLPAEGEIRFEQAFDHVHPDDVAPMRAAAEAALDPARRLPYLAEYRVVGAGGEQRWVETRGRAFFDGRGGNTLMVGTAMDVTARKEGELARQGLVDALEAQPFMQICVLEGPRHVVTMANAAYRESVAGGRDLVGMPVLDAFPHLASTGFGTLMDRALRLGEPFVGREVATPLDRGDGVLVERHFNFAIQPVRGPRGGNDALLNISHDVTEVVEGRRRLERAAAQERERADFERQLIGIVSHDLRNPLSAMRLGVALLMRDDGLAAPSLKAVLRIHSTLERTIRLVTDLLDFTQMRLGPGLPMNRKLMGLHTVVRQVIDEVHIAFPDRTIEHAAAGHGEGLWDRDRIAQVALNLITNALKYSPPDAAVRVSTRDAGDQCVLEVSNAGVPIAPEQLPHLFEPMQRGHHESPDLGRSVGLGLFIVKHIVEAHGGSVTVSSADTGTTFAVALPRSASTTESHSG
jgi:sigma-B regulation protein RsbU (phosphoserine phosphatase)